MFILNVHQIDEFFTSTWKFIFFDTWHRRLQITVYHAISLTKRCKLALTIQHWLLHLLLHFWRNVNTLCLNLFEESFPLFPSSSLFFSFLLWVDSCNTFSYWWFLTSQSDFLFISFNFQIRFLLVWLLWIEHNVIFIFKPVTKQVLVFKVPTLRILSLNLHELKFSWPLITWFVILGVLLPVLQKTTGDVVLSDERYRIIRRFLRSFLFNGTITLKMELSFWHKYLMRKSFPTSTPAARMTRLICYLSSPLFYASYSLVELNWNLLYLFCLFF